MFFGSVNATGKHTGTKNCDKDPIFITDFFFHDGDYAQFTIMSIKRLLLKLPLCWIG